MKAKRFADCTAEELLVGPQIQVLRMEPKPLLQLINDVTERPDMCVRGAAKVEDHRTQGQICILPTWICLERNQGDQVVR